MLPFGRMPLAAPRSSEDMAAVALFVGWIQVLLASLCHKITAGAITTATIISEVVNMSEVVVPRQQ